MAFAEMVMWGKFEDLLLKVNFPHMAPIGALMNMSAGRLFGPSELMETIELKVGQNPARRSAGHDAGHTSNRDRAGCRRRFCESTAGAAVDARH